MVIESERLILRSWQENDVDDLVEGLNNINVSKWLTTVPYPYTKEDARKFINYAKHYEKEKKGYILAIVLKENNKVIGGTDITIVSQRDGISDGGIWLNEKYQANGYGTEAFSMKTKYSFENMGVRKIENGYFYGNKKSEKMQLKLGFKNEGIKRKHFLCLATNEYVDECITGLLKEEFKEYKI